MFQVTVEREFCAAHAIVMGGVREPRHGHNWRLIVAVAGPQLDDDGLLCDFHTVEQMLDRVVMPLQNVDLNETPPFDQVNPTAENGARHVAESMCDGLPAGVRLDYVSVTEAPGCQAIYRPD